MPRQAFRDVAWRPLSGGELAELLGRDRHYLRNKHLIPMVAGGVLALAIS